MTRLLYAFVKGAALIHESILHLNDRSGLFLTDKQLHFLIMGLIGMGILAVIYPLFPGDNRYRQYGVCGHTVRDGRIHASFYYLCGTARGVSPDHEVVQAVE